jgi:demethylmenaquinone methyltransferase/2-methoxy-6-polyprenyl-1,4-benzoquinol methylase
MVKTERDERESRRVATVPDPMLETVARIFDSTGEAYDEIVDRATAGEDFRWKSRMLDLLPAPRRVLDLACGTGILTRLLLERFPDCRVVGVDVTEEYLAVSRRRAAERADGRVELILGRAEEAPWGNRTFDAVVSCYLPKYADRPRLVEVLARTLEPGGTLLLHDFTLPSSPSVRQVWEKRWAGLREEAARQLPGSVAMMELAPRVVAEEPWADDLLCLLPRAGFEEVGLERLSMGTAAIVKARRVAVRL